MGVVAVAVIGAGDGTIDGKRPAALPGVISLVLITLFSVGSGPGWIGIKVGAGDASGVGTGMRSRTDSETARGRESLPAEARPTALTVMEVAVRLAVTLAWSAAGILPGVGIVHELWVWQPRVVNAACWPAVTVNSEIVTRPAGVQSVTQTCTVNVAG